MKVYVIVANWNDNLDYECAGVYSKLEDAEWANQANGKLLSRYHGYVAEMELDYKLNEATVNKFEELGVTVPNHLKYTGKVLR